MKVNEISKKKSLIKTYVTSGVIVAVILVINLVAMSFYTPITLFFGGEKQKIIGASGNSTTYFESDYASKEEATAAANDLIEEIQSEGSVLLKNSGGLPLASGSKISVFGTASERFLYSGSGSGQISSTVKIPTLQEALENAGYELNPSLISLYKENKPTRGSVGLSKSTFEIGELPITDVESIATTGYEDAAIIVIGRVGGENGDLPTTGVTDNSANADDPNSNKHFMELSDNEEALVAYVTSKFENVIVIVNSGSAMELNFIEENSAIKAALWVGYPGATGITAIGEILNGSINPSGHLVDTYAVDFMKDPAVANFGSYQYTNVDNYSNMGKYFVQYEEGIYMGYRYYETRGVTDGEEWYQENVVYPFGYGLSYTTFDWTIEEADTTVNQSNLEKDTEIVVAIKVTNTGSIAGKDVVQLYYSTPYVDNGIEKAAKVLGGFAKTELLQPGESEIVHIQIPLENMASYDYSDANQNGFKGYEVEAGVYEIHISRNAHESMLQLEYNVIEGYQYDIDSSTGNLVVNQFDDVSDGIYVYLSRADWEGTWPQSPTESDQIAPESVKENYALPVNDDSDEMPITNATNERELIQLRGLSYSDPLWDELLDQLSVDEMVSLISKGGYQTEAIVSINKPATTDPDGPAGFSSFFSASTVYGTAYNSECVIAATWNTDLAKRMGIAIGEEGLQGNNEISYNGWYAPAMNLHRSPFAGRNFEYYSEDSYLSGAMATKVVEGAQSKGVYCYVKHFALNDQETNRTNNGYYVWANEQTIRELYLAPFEQCVKEGKTLAIMSSYNRIGTTWTGGSYALLTEVLRNEWGFQGVVITDYRSQDYMNIDQMLRAGGDLVLSSTGNKPSDISSTTAITNLRRASKNILYTVVNSNAMNGLEYGVTYIIVMPIWEKIMFTVDFVILCFLAINLIIKVRTKQSTK